MGGDRGCITISHSKSYNSVLGFSNTHLELLIWEVIESLRPHSCFSWWSIDVGFGIVLHSRVPLPFRTENDLWNQILNGESDLRLILAVALRLVTWIFNMARVTTMLCMLVLRAKNLQVETLTLAPATNVRYGWAHSLIGGDFLVSG